MNKQELKILLDGPVNCYLSGKITYGRFIELINEEFPYLNLYLSDIMPTLFNQEVDQKLAQEYLELMSFPVVNLYSYWFKVSPFDSSKYIFVEKKDKQND